METSTSTDVLARNPICLHDILRIILATTLIPFTNRKSDS
jgi:hypothetical protein